MASFPIEKWIIKILEIAIADEKGSQEKYKLLALYSKQKEVRQIFVRLYEEERAHERSLKGLLVDFRETLKKRKVRKAQ